MESIPRGAPQGNRVNEYVTDRQSVEAMSVLDSQGGGRRWTIRHNTMARFLRRRSFSVISDDLPDTRQQAKVVYPLDEVLLLALRATLAGAEAFTDVARFGERKPALLRRFRPFRDDTPPYDRIGDIFATAMPNSSSAVSSLGWLQ